MNKTTMINLIKWAFGLSAMLVLMASVGVAHGGGRWSGIDPELIVNGQKYNVWVEWPSEYSCSIDNMYVSITVSEDVSAELVAESIDDFNCDDGSSVTLQTNTSIGLKEADSVVVGAEISSTETFDVALRIYENGTEIRYCMGKSNEAFACKSIDVSDSDAGEDGDGGEGD